MSDEQFEKDVRKWQMDTEVWRNNLEVRKHTDMVWGQIISDSFNAVIAYSLAAIRGAFWLNGGGAVAMLTYMADSEKAQCVNLEDALMLFIFGAIMSVGSACVSYIGQAFFTSESRYRWGKQATDKMEYEAKQRACGAGGLCCQIVGSALIAVSIICFWEGCQQAYHLLKHSPTTC